MKSEKVGISGTIRYNLFKFTAVLTLLLYSQPFYLYKVILTELFLKAL